MKNKDYILLIGFSEKGTRSIEELGEQYIVVGDFSRAINFSPSKLCRQINFSSFQDWDGFKNSYLEIKEMNGKPKLIISFSEFGVEFSSKISELESLPTNPLYSVQNLKDKIKMRNIFKEDSDLKIEIFNQRDTEEIQQFFNTGKTLIAKPKEGYGSIGITRLKNIFEFNKWIKFKDPEIEWILEEFIDGKEYSVESISFKGVHSIVSITEKYLSKSFVEEMHVVPASLSLPLQKKTNRIVSKALGLLGVEGGVCHTEIKVNNNDIKIIESHSRPGGDDIPLLVEYATGVNLYKESIKAFLNKKPNLQNKKLGSFSSYFPPHNNNSFLKAIAIGESKNIVRVNISSKLGSKLNPVNSNLDRLGNIIISGTCNKDLMENISKVKMEIKIN